ncbi:MAG: carbon-nitrogen hydrolase family protein [Thiotrichaceae bacterium]|nr:carbon-nitrogen hydrolase family protein [Thiotrichaceae bacterium]
MAVVAAVQMASGPQVQANLMEVARLIAEAASQGAELVVLPESFAIMGDSEAATVAIAEVAGEGDIQSFISQCAKKNKVWIVAGTIPIRSDNEKKAYATSILFNDKGEQLVRYNKMHLFDVKICESKETYTESDTVAVGKQVVVVDTPFGKLGMAVCYDLRFPEFFREMVDQGAEIFTIPSAFTETTGRAHWEVLIRARAIENLCYVIAPAQGGYHVSGRTTYGHAMLVDYWGNVLESLDKGAGVILAEIDSEKQKMTRQTFPVLDHRI